MTVLEKAVVDLANALDALETKIDARLDDQTADSDAVKAARTQARAARDHAEIAAQGLDAAIKDVKALLEADAANKAKG